VRIRRTNPPSLLLLVLGVNEDECEYEDLLRLRLLFVLGVKEDECEYEELIRLRLLFVLGVKEDECKDEGLLIFVFFYSSLV